MDIGPDSGQLAERVNKIEARLEEAKSGRSSRISLYLSIFATILSVPTAILSFGKAFYEARNYYPSRPELEVTSDPPLTLKFNPTGKQFRTRFQAHAINNTEWVETIASASAEILCPSTPVKIAKFYRPNINFEASGNKLYKILVKKGEFVDFVCEINCAINEEIKAILMQEDTRRKLTVTFVTDKGEGQPAVFWFDLGPKQAKEFFEPATNTEQEIYTTCTNYSNEDK
jgi:hypothetical protein